MARRGTLSYDVDSPPHYPALGFCQISAYRNIASLRKRAPGNCSRAHRRTSE